MRLLKKRPRVAVRAPRGLVPGASFVVDVDVIADREVPVEHLEVRISGMERSTVGSGKSQSTHQHGLVSLSARPLGATLLPAGSHQFPVRVALPAGIPASYRGPRAASEYTLTVRVAIPYWPDRVERFLLHVVEPPGATVAAGTPRLFSSAPHGPRGAEPHLEVSLASDGVAAGGVLQGSVALSNTTHNRYRRVDLSLVATERVYDSAGRERGRSEAQRWRLAVPLGQRVGEAEPIPFRLQVPADVPPTARSILWRLDWTLEVKADVVWASDVALSIPVHVAAAGAALAEVSSAPPVVGSERVQRIWRQIAQEEGLAFDGRSLGARLGECSLEVRREHRGGEGIFLVGEIRYPSLHLDLDGGLATGFRRWLGGGVSFGDAAWDRAHYIAGREAAQVRSFGVVLFAELRRHRVADLDDEHLVVELRDAGATHATLRGFAASVRELARQIPLARDAIPPPAALAHAVPAWEDLARALGGRLERPRMAITGAQVDGIPCEVRTDWDEAEPARTVLELRPTVPVEPAHRLAWTASAGLLAGDESRFVREAGELLPVLREGAESLALMEGSVRLSLGGPVEAPHPVVTERLRRMARLLAHLRAAAGPYR